MTKEAMRDAFIAGWNARERYRDGSGTAPLIEFDLYWQPVNETLDRGGPILASGPAPVTPFDFSKLPRPGDAHYRSRGGASVVVATTTKDQDGNSVEALVDAVEFEEAARFAAFDPDAFVPHPEPREDDE